MGERDVDESNQRQAKILDALHDGRLRYGPDVAIFPMMDTLQLLVQKPLVFAIIRQNGTEVAVRFSTYCDPEYADRFRKETYSLLERLRDGLPTKDRFIPLNLHVASVAERSELKDDGRRFYLFASELRASTTSSSYSAAYLPAEGPVFSQVDPEDANMLEELFESLGKHENELSHHITSALENASRPNVLNLSPLLETDFECDDDLRLPEGIQAEYCKWMRSIVSKALSEVSDSPILQRKVPNGNCWLDLYCTIRRAVPEKRYGKFPYTAQYILSQDQRDTIIEQFSDDVADGFERPFGKQCRSISDSVFYSAVSEFIYEDDISRQTESKPGDAWDRYRSGAEQNILAIRETFEAGEKRAQRFIVPIHVGGIVWATLCTTSVPNSKVDWNRNYYLYRILLTQIAERLRVAAKDQYSACLKAIFQAEMSQFEKGHTLITVRQAINDKWRKLTAYFPYNMIELVAVRPIRTLNGRRKEYVTLRGESANPHECFRGAIGFDQFGPLDLESLRRDLDLLFDSSLGVVEQHRLALRTAAAAIMGRNMSHNLGSHVLARYSARIGKEGNQPRDAKLDGGEPDDGKLDRRTEFLTYLQRRMDFLAEVSTSDQSFWSETLELRDQLKRLNYKAQKARFNSKGENERTDQNEPILLSFITGKDSVRASVEWGLPPDNIIPKPNNASADPCNDVPAAQADHLIACPGGEVGIHALYIILENIIRNSARHATTELGDSVEIHVTVEDQDHEELLKLDIIDPRSDVNAALHAGKPLHIHVNKNLKKQILLEDNSPDPKNWGIREMQICAHYLRGFPFSELDREKPSKSFSPAQQGAIDPDQNPNKDDPPVLRAYSHRLANGRDCLKYTIYLQRAKLMAAVVKGDGSSERSAWKRYDPASLRRKGICLVESPSWLNVNWTNIAEQVDGYGFLLVEEGISLPPRRAPASVSLPMRIFKGWSAAKIKDTIDCAVAHDNGPWMEPLHEGMAKLYSEKRPSWKDKSIWGVAIYENSKNTVPPSPVLPRDPGKLECGLFAVEKDSDRDREGAIFPLPPALKNWHDRLIRTGPSEEGGTENEIIAAAWFDHAAMTDFGGEGAMLGHAKDKILYPSLYNPEAMWISAEAVFSDSPHNAYLRACPRGVCWELLAAAMPRIAVLDERVQSEFDKSGPRGLPFKVLWPAMGVWVPPKSNADNNIYCNLDVPDFDQCRTFLTNPTLKTEQFPIDILVLHLTVLEALTRKGKPGELLTETVEALVSGTQARDAEIVLVTGRGVPAIEMDNVRYLPISALLESLVIRPSKLALMRTLWSASRPRNGMRE